MMNIDLIKKVALFVFIAFLAVSSTAQITVSAEVDSTNMLIGDQLKLHIFADHAPDVSIQQVDLSVFKEEKELEVLKEADWDTLKSKDGFILQKDITFTVFDSGFYWLPELPISYLQNGVSKVVKTQRIPMNVSTVQLGADSLLSETDPIKELAPIKDIIREKANWRDYLPFGLALLALAAIVSVFYFLKKRKAMKEMPPPPEIIIPAHEIALTALNQLRKEELWQKGQIKIYQSRLTHIIRAYLENRYNIPALESTTDEILGNLKKVDFDGSWKNKLTNILQVADLVKFAKAEPPADFHDKVWQEAEDFVKATKEVVVEADQAN